MSKNISSIDRLRSLPALFRGADLTIRFGWTSQTASHYLYLWKARNFVQGLGGKSDVFANLIVGPNPEWDQAVQMAMPSAVYVGVEALRRAGWTTQIQVCPTIAVNADHGMYKLTEFRVVKRRDQWFESVETGALSEGMPVLRPAWALADMIHKDGWERCGLWKDDIDLDAATEQDELDWAAAVQFFGMPDESLHDQAMDGR